MKKYFMFIVCLLSVVSISTTAFARDDKTFKEYGTVEAITADSFTLKVKNSDKVMTFAVDKFSDFEVEFADRTKHDLDVPFSDLKVGDSVKVEAYAAEKGTHALVDDVEIRR